MTRLSVSVVSVAAPEVIRPAFLSTPPSAVGDLSDEVADLAIALEQDVREEERIALAALTPVKANGMPAGLEACIIAGRQQLKSWSLEMCLIHDGWVTKVGRCMWSAHLTQTSDDTFEHLRMLIDSFDWLSKRVRTVYGGNGNHKVVFHDKHTTYPTLGASGKQQETRFIQFGARQTGKTGRGRTKFNRVTFDEWLFGTKAMVGAQVPTMGAAQDRYIRHGSSAGVLVSEDLRRLRDRGRRGGDPSLSYVEWTLERLVDGERVLPECADAACLHVHTSEGCYLNDFDRLRDANPAMGTPRLTYEFVEQERLKYDPVEFARERGGIWEDPPSGTLDDVLAAWPDRADPAATFEDPITLGVCVSHDSRSAAIVACGAGPSGPVVDVVEWRRAGTAWVADRLAELRRKHDVSAVGVVKSHTSTMSLGLPDVTVLPGEQFGGACIAFATAVAESGVTHLGQDPLDIAVGNARRKFVGEGWRWSLVESSGDISPLGAAVVALDLFDETPYDPLANIG